MLVPITAIMLGSVMLQCSLLGLQAVAWCVCLLQVTNLYRPLL